MSVILIGLPPFLSPLVSVLLALVGGLALNRSRRVDMDPPFDAEREYAKLERRVRTKANHPLTYVVRNWLR